MDDDFDTPIALSHLFDLVRAINRARDSGTPVERIDEAQSVLRELTTVVGLRLDVEKARRHEAASFIDLVVELRNRLRQEEHWALADQIRDRLAELGIVLENGRDGTIWRSNQMKDDTK